MAAHADISTGQTGTAALHVTAAAKAAMLMGGNTLTSIVAPTNDSAPLVR